MQCIKHPYMRVLLHHILPNSCSCFTLRDDSVCTRKVHIVRVCVTLVSVFRCLWELCVVVCVRAWISCARVCVSCELCVWVSFRDYCQFGPWGAVEWPQSVRLLRAHQCIIVHSVVGECIDDSGVSGTLLKSFKHILTSFRPFLGTCTRFHTI